MSAGLAERAIAGVQTPRVDWFPPGEWDYSRGEECIVWARDVLSSPLDPWEQLCVRRLGARRPDGRWVCPDFGLLLSRRNGKSHVLMVWLLFCVLELGMAAAEYTAHHGKTVRATFRIARKLLDNAVEGALPAHRPYVSAGRESLLFDTGQELAFSTRTASAGRGTGADILAVDEAQEADDDEMEALTPTLGDRSMTVPGPQLIYAGSAGNLASVVFARVRRRGLARRSMEFGYLEWSIDDVAYFAADAFERERLATSVESMAQANPSLNAQRADGSGLALSWLLRQLDTLTPPGFAREHLAVGTWPKDDGSDWPIPRAAWTRAAHPDVSVPATLVLAISATWGERAFSIGAAGSDGEDGCYGWLERMARGSDWVIKDLLRLIDENTVAAVLLDGGGPASTQANAIENALRSTGVQLHRLSGREAAQACGDLSDAVTSVPPTFTHRGQVEVDAALAGTKRKDIGDGLWVFDRPHSETDIAPLEAVTLARHGWVLFGAVDEAWGFFE